MTVFPGRLLSADEAVRADSLLARPSLIAARGSEPYEPGGHALATQCGCPTDVDMHFMLSLRKEEPA